jgi:subtilisin family serine protease
LIKFAGALAPPNDDLLVVNRSAFESLLSTIIPQRKSSFSAQSLDGVSSVSPNGFRYMVANEGVGVQHEFIVALNPNSAHYDEVSEKISPILRTLAAEVRQTFEVASKGKSWRIRYTPSPSFPEFPVNFISKIGCIQYVEQVQRLQNYQGQIQELPGGTLPSSNPILWGLDRIDQDSDKLDSNFVVGPTGTGVHVYIIDSGLQASHVEFNSGISGSPGRADVAFTVDAVQRESRAKGVSDCTGHGTHVAGIVGGLGVGVAKNAFLHSVRVMGCDDTSNADVIEALEWILKNGKKPAVINMSLGPHAVDGKYPKVQSIDDAIRKVVADGIPVVVAAGNDNLDACTGSPAGSDGVLAVGATSWSASGGDAKSSFSNFGSCVSIFAPGSDIVSASPTAKGGYTTLRGTSQAAPFVTGVIAQLLQLNPSMKPRDLYQQLQTSAIQGVVKLARNSGNRLLKVSSSPSPDSGLLAIPQLNIDPALLPSASRPAAGTPNKRTGDIFSGGELTWVIGSAVIGGVLLSIIGVIVLIRRRRLRRLQQSPLPGKPGTDLQKKDGQSLLADNESEVSLLNNTSEEKEDMNSSTASLETEAKPSENKAKTGPFLLAAPPRTAHPPIGVQRSTLISEEQGAPAPSYSNINVFSGENSIVDRSDRSSSSTDLTGTDPIIPSGGLQWNPNLATELQASFHSLHANNYMPSHPGTVPLMAPSMAHTALHYPGVPQLAMGWAPGMGRPGMDPYSIAAQRHSNVPTFDPFFTSQVGSNPMFMGPPSPMHSPMANLANMPAGQFTQASPFAHSMAPFANNQTIPNHAQLLATGGQASIPLTPNVQGEASQNQPMQHSHLSPGPDVDTLASMIMQVRERISQEKES